MDWVENTEVKELSVYRVTQDQSNLRQHRALSKSGVSLGHCQLWPPRHQNNKNIKNKALTLILQS